MQKLVNIFLLCGFLLVHLQVIAGEPILIDKLSSLQPVISIHVTAEEAASLKKDGLNDAGKTFALYVVMNDISSAIPVAGQYQLDKNVLSFTPFYKLGHDMEFETRYERGGNIIAIKRFRTPPHPMSDVPVYVETMYPLCDTIPYNTLYFHVRFTQPMVQDKQAYRCIHVFDDKGEERMNAWRQKSFWLDEGKLLVLMIHPGRVKNGIHYESPLFDSGRYYTIKVGKGIKDINGNTIAKEYEQRYFVRDEDRQSPKPYINTAHLPHVRTTDPVMISFSEGVDNASVLDGVKVIDNNGNAISCNIREKASDNVYMINPVQEWQKGTYTVLLKGAVYDFAGNRINRLFEITDVSEMEADKKETSLEFTIK